MSQYALVTDIGGTNARFALYDLTTNKLSAITKILISKDDDLLVLIKNYLANQSISVDMACIAIACPIDDTDMVNMTNNNLSFSRSALIKALNLKQLEVINDFTAVSTSIPQLTDKDLVKIGGDDADLNYPIAIYGAGTGLGVSHLIKVNQHWISLSGEGGHTELPMTNEKEDRLLAELRKKFGRVSSERFLSGNGIVNIYQALLNINNQPIEEITPDVIVKKALSNSCPLCLETLTYFCTFMGRFGGNLALTLNTQGGVYIAGGIVPRFIEFFKSSPFRHAFENKGRMSYLVKKIPVYVITHEDPGLLGAGVYLQNSLNKMKE
ncbi:MULTISPECIES: glucokinase [unclassified Gilliamella]|uniref:glucokinase n=1 Tax=unclassified Gilliamella TaxID=2685620 RepID=UPI00226A783F|nr:MULTISPECIES: glucokinase [unclassified Gilliamella]MCX8641891.1 glucokinase [Gilliamella sp. B3835]MCX8706691.1 glucokinase [Gilliamella sp. B3783]MCX8708840.1 glucokinase [Gilliamella sp. B3780]MCX8713180.1 glucokinase [Gilliamella sp. B3468]MCX8713624.1 glucokinase [Gilliamella sp. B3781]